MAKLSNSPRQALNFDLERRKSYSFKFVMRHVDGTLVDLTGCTIRFVMKPLGADEDAFDLNNLLVNNEATLGTTGEGLFAFQAAELDGDPGEYPYAIVMWTADNYSSVLMKGTVNLVDNTESLSMYRQYGVTSPEAALELTLRQGDVVQVAASSTVKVLPITEAVQDIVGSMVAVLVAPTTMPRGPSPCPAVAAGAARPPSPPTTPRPHRLRARVRRTSSRRLSRGPLASCGRPTLTAAPRPPSPAPRSCRCSPSPG